MTRGRTWCAALIAVACTKASGPSAESAPAPVVSSSDPLPAVATATPSTESPAFAESPGSGGGASDAPVEVATTAVPLANPAPSEPPRKAAACGRLPGERVERVRWPHGDGDAHCDALETRWANVPHQDRACHSDDECTLVVSDGNCIILPLTKKAAARSEYREPPCGNPMSGACATRPLGARCVAGCCAAGASDRVR